MTVNQTETEATPEVALRQVSTEPDRVKRFWSIAWVVENKGAHTLEIFAVRLPHGQFKSEEHRFEPALKLAAGQSDEFKTLVRCDEPAGLVTENAFVIFSVIWSEQAWRIFVRIRVVVNSEGEPVTVTESVTTQMAGFSGVTA